MLNDVTIKGKPISDCKADIGAPTKQTSGKPYLNFDWRAIGNNSTKEALHQCRF